MAKVTDSILSSIRTHCDLLDETVDSSSDFDNNLVTYFGGAAAELAQIGVGIETFFLEDETQTWIDWLGEVAVKTQIFPLARTYALMYVKMLFDPPAPATATYTKELLDRQLWRLQVYADSLLEEGGVINGREPNL